MTMKFNTVFFVFIVWLLFYTCNKNEPEWVRINDNFSLKLNEQIKVIDDRYRAMYVSVVEIEDSRCPSDVFCIHPGNAIVKVVIEDTRNSQFSTLLCIGDCSPSINDMRSFVFYNVEYTIQLLGVDPVPAAANQKDRKSVVLNILRN
jgi:hypothetical protein